MKIYITRHGETEWNKVGRMQGWKNSNLTPKGIENARKLGERLQNINFDCIYCSPLGRAIETANQIKGDKDTQIIIDESLREMGFGKWEGMDFTDIGNYYATQHYNYWNKPHLYQTIQGESFEELLNRVEKVLNKIIESSLGENILIVSHAVTIKAIYAIIKNIPLEDFWNPPFMADTCLNVLEVTDKERRFILEGDTAHLDG